MITTSRKRDDAARRSDGDDGLDATRRDWTARLGGEPWTAQLGLRNSDGVTRTAQLGQRYPDGATRTERLGRCDSTVTAARWGDGDDGASAILVVSDGATA